MTKNEMVLWARWSIDDVRQMENPDIDYRYENGEMVREYDKAIEKRY